MRFPRGRRSNSAFCPVGAGAPHVVRRGPHDIGDWRRHRLHQRQRLPIATSTPPLQTRQPNQIKGIRIMRLLTATFLALFSTAAPALAGDISLEHPWSRETPNNAPVGAGYVTIKNSGAALDRLVSATADVAGKVEIHEMAMTDGVMKMREISGLDIPAGKSAELKPGGYHIMFMNLKRPLKAGETIKGTLTFEKAGAVPVEYKVETMSGQGGGHGEHKH